MSLTTSKSSAFLRAHRVLACYLGCWVTILGFSGPAVGDEPGVGDSDPPEVVFRSRPISHGFVLLDGAYVPSPYVVERRGNEVFINGHAFSFKQLTRGAGRQFVSFRGPPPRQNFVGMGRRGRGFFGGPRGPFSSAPFMHGIVRQLEEDCLFIGFGGEHSTVFDSPHAAQIFNTLLADSSPDSKMSVFEDERIYGELSTDQWSQIVAAFVPTSELRQRVAVLTEQERVFDKQSKEVTGTAQWYQLLASERARYGVTVTAMVLAVVALGNLLLYRPQGRGRWSDVNDDEQVLNMRRIVIILALLGSFDLLLTLAAQQAGAFLELNPLGSKLITSPLLLAAFKLTSLVLACCILLKLQRYRGAQVASWWLCMVCTVLTFRWVTFNSLFMS